MEFTPAVMAVLGAAALMACYAFFKLLQSPRGVYILLIGMIFASGLAVQIDRVGTYLNHSYLQPLQIQRASLYLAMGVVAFLGMMVHLGKLRLTNIPVQGGLILLIQLFNSLLRFYHEGPVSGAQSIVFAVVTLLPLLMLIPATLVEWEDFWRAIRVVAFAGAVWCGATAVQILIDVKQVKLGWQNRFTGLLGNPQACGLYMSVFTVCATWLVLNETKRQYRWFWIGLVGILSVYTIWTGSRTGVAVTALGMMFILYARMGKAIVFLPLLGALGFGAFQVARLLGMDISAAERLTWSQNTRELVWQLLLEDALKNPVLGTGFAGTRANENSYLVAFGAYGVGGGVLVLVLTGVSFFYMLRVLRVRAWLSAEIKPVADLILGFNAMFFAGAVFEWYIISRLEGMLTYMMVFSAMASRLLAKAGEEAAWRAEYEAEGGSPDGVAYAPDSGGAGTTRDDYGDYGDDDASRGEPRVA